MPWQCEQKRGHRWNGLLIAALTLFLGLSEQPVRAADFRTDSALAQVPADADFYWAILRNKEQVDLIRTSNTWKKLMEQEGVKKLLAYALDQANANEQIAQALQMLESKEMKPLRDLLLEAVSDEVFVYGGSGWGDLLSVLVRASTAINYAMSEGILDGGNAEKVLFRAIFSDLEKNRARLKVPDLVIGFKLRDPKKAEQQVKALEALAKGFLDGNDVTRGRFKAAKRASGEMVLTLTLESKQIPWDEVPFDKAESKPGEFAALAKHLKSLQVTFSLGVKGDYLLLGVTADLADLDHLGGKGEKLVDSRQLAPLARHARERVTAISYSSTDYNNKLLDAYDLSDGVHFMKRLVNRSELAEARRKELEKDLDNIALQVKKWKPAGGASMGVSYLIRNGSESYFYEHGDHSALVGKQLGLLDHCGGSPLFAAGVMLPASKVFYMQLLDRVRGIFAMSGFVLVARAADPGGESTRVSKVGAEILQKAINTTNKLFLPALQSGELGLVIDAKWKSKKWWQSSPDFPRELPMLEVGLLLGLRDADLFARAIKDYRLTIKEAMEKLTEGGRPELPFGFGAPATEKTTAGTLYLYPIPEGAGLDKQFLPTAGLGKSAGVFTLSKEHSSRLLTPTPLKTKGTALAGKKNLLGFALFDFPALVDAARPWAEAIPDVVPPENKEEARAFAKHFQSAAELLKAFRGYSSATYLEGGLLVTHSLWAFEDR
jgi:hypothetical protein